jgi:hypothetical protein
MVDNFPFPVLEGEKSETEDGGEEVSNLMTDNFSFPVPQGQQRETKNDEKRGSS